MILGAVLLGDIAVAGAQENPLFSCAFPDQLGTPIPGTSSDRVTEQLYAEDLARYFEEQDDLHDFYSIAAQVIPTLLVAMLFAETVRGLHGDLRLAGVAVFTAVALVGEGFAIRGVTGAGDHYPDAFLTMVGLSAAAGGVVWVAVTPSLAQLVKRRRPALELPTQVAATALTVLFVMWAAGVVSPEYIHDSPPPRPSSLGDYGGPAVTRFELGELGEAPQRRLLAAICERLDAASGP
jgi:hypothetical protein